MKKYILSLPALLFLLGYWGCEKDFNEVVDPEENIYSIADSQIDYKLQDSTLTIRLAFNNDKGIVTVHGRISEPDGDEIPGSPVTLLDNGENQNDDITKDDNIYSGKITLNSTNPSGKYSIEFVITDNSDQSKLAATHSFDFDNGQPKIAPVISSVVGPDTIVVGNETRAFILAATITDANGLADIKRVFSITVRPNGTSSGAQFDFNDNGESGDQVAGDGIYSFGFSVTPDNIKGTYQFIIQAQDNSNLLSEKFIHKITLQ